MSYRPCSASSHARLALATCLPLALLVIPWPAAAIDKARLAPLVSPSEDGVLLVDAAGAGHEIRLPRATRIGRALDAGAEGWIVAGDHPTRHGRALALTRLAKGEQQMLPEPAGDGPIRMSPVPVVGASGLRGLVWLEGDDVRRLTVRAALWSGEEFGAPETLSGQAPGSQLAPDAVLLADDSWLVAWSRFDGEDDEIVWTRGLPGGFATPRPVAPDNAVPDITPRLVALGSGALIAWSRFDGNDYRVVVAPLEEDGFGKPGFSGPAGSLEPSFAGVSEGRAYLLYQTVVPGSWRVAELESGGRARRELQVPLTSRERPSVALEAAGAVLQFPDGTKPAAGSFEVAR